MLQKIFTPGVVNFHLFHNNSASATLYDAQVLFPPVFFSFSFLSLFV